jgi:hypothetical protein
MKSVFVTPASEVCTIDRCLIDLTIVAYDIILHSPVIVVFAISVINVIRNVVVKFYHCKIFKWELASTNRVPSCLLNYNACHITWYCKPCNGVI